MHFRDICILLLHVLEWKTRRWLKERLNLFSSLKIDIKKLPSVTLLKNFSRGMPDNPLPKNHPTPTGHTPRNPTTPQLDPIPAQNLVNLTYNMTMYNFKNVAMREPLFPPLKGNELARERRAGWRRGAWKECPRKKFCSRPWTSIKHLHEQSATVHSIKLYKYKL